MMAGDGAALWSLFTNGNELVPTLLQAFPLLAHTLYVIFVPVMWRLSCCSCCRCCACCSSGATASSCRGTGVLVRWTTCIAACHTEPSIRPVCSQVAACLGKPVQDTHSPCIDRGTLPQHVQPQRSQRCSVGGVGDNIFPIITDHWLSVLSIIVAPWFPRWRHMTCLCQSPAQLPTAAPEAVKAQPSLVTLASCSRCCHC